MRDLNATVRFTVPGNKDLCGSFVACCLGMFGIRLGPVMPEKTFLFATLGSH